MPTVDLEQSLRAEIEGYVERRLGAAREDIERLRVQLDTALARLAGGESPGAGEPALTVALADHLRNARNQGIEEAAAGSQRARASSDVALIKAAIDDIDERRTQSDVLTALVNRAASFAPRVAFFVVKQDRVTGWRARGLEGTVGDDSVREISLAVSSETLLGEVARTRRTWSGAPGTHADDGSVYGHFGGDPPQRIVSIPLVARDKAVAVLYADSAGQDADSINLEALETLVRVTGMAVELLALKRTQTAAPAPEAAASPAPEAPDDARAAEAEQPTHFEQPVAVEAQPMREEEEEEESAATKAPPPFASSEPSHAFAAEPEADTSTSFEMTPAPDAHASFEEPSVTPVFAEPAEEPSVFASPQADSGTDSGTSSSPPPDAWTGRADITSEPAFSQSAGEPAFSQPAGAPEAATPRRRDTALPIEVSAEERPLHDKAWRFARLLVSEIKLYNESKVTEGRAAGDLYRRLSEDIDRSRVMYEERYGHQVGGRFDYFHHALVSTLAGGDASKLGDGYPGASATA